jgi:hypothetical protein
VIALLLDKSIILSILPLLIAIPVAVGLLIFLSHKLQQPPSKPVSRTTGEHFQKIGRTTPADVYTDSPTGVAQAAGPYASRDQLPGLDDIDTISGA